MKNALIVILIFMSTGCQYMPNRQIDAALTRTQERYLEQIKREDSAEVPRAKHYYEWGEALQAMYKYNTQCLRAGHRVEDAKVSQRAIWRSFIPGLSAGLSDTVSLDDLSSAFVDPTFTVNSFVAFGNLLSLPKNVYTRKIAYIASELGEQAIMRTQTVELYKLFQERHLWEIEGENYMISKSLTDAMVVIDDEMTRQALSTLDKSIESWQDREKLWLEKVGEFYNVAPGEVLLNSSSAPKILYKNNELDFYDTKRWGKLQLKLLALQEMAEDGRIKEAYIRYLPTPSLTARAPSIYNNTSDSDFNVNDIVLAPRLSWRLDTTGVIGQQIRRLKREKPIKDWERHKRIKSEVQKLYDGKKALREAEEELMELKQAKKEYVALIREGLVNQSAEVILEKLQLLYREEIELNATIVSISTGFWLLDEEWWTKHQLPWKKRKS